ncbi:hypothetical protein GOD34_18360 [Sinorhizobium medicae]|uniref:hypothetical protein n=1 Tax=Sinorhizobium medicae TaxID=110321 RepID=UPI000FDBF5CE|nr:hypothetical protein [Sinorhizobium medicae]MDX0194303.1 hypothetical protein [Sinorhizobium meliloti]MDX0438932.1 hypothetical protein [Sinorhizobium medicae]MDX0652730.1 hypothetical protein [Sinorhizobium medicae]MDX0948147.1 hypothetical protein [Sinorhizobium medicae]MDX1156596.1 hypothetical protein [Sinorhizobium medicae]
MLETPEKPAYSRQFFLPFDFTVTFVWLGETFRCEWTPDLPRIRKPRALNKLLRAYQAARRDFLSDIATMHGVRIVALDLPDDSFDLIEPKTRQ